MMNNDIGDQLDDDGDVQDHRPPRASMVVPKAQGDSASSAPARREVRFPEFDRPPPPELFCPFPSGLNPLVDEVQPASVDWALRMGLVGEGSASRLERASVGLLEALVFHTASREILQLAADWTTLFCLLDDRVEIEGLGPVALSAYLSQVLASFRGTGPPPPDPVGNGFADLRRRMTKIAGDAFADRFASEVEEIFAAFIWEEINRRKRIRPSRGAYVVMRSITVGLRPQFLLGDLAGGGWLRPSRPRRPEITRLETLASRAVGWANDVFTYPKELEYGEIHNLVFVLMDSESLSISDAIRRVAAIHDEDVRQFLSVQARLGPLHELDPGTKSYVAMLRQWIRGHLDWARETGRYQLSDARISA